MATNCQTNTPSIHTEATTRYETVSFFDKNGAPEAPVSVLYRLDDVTNTVAVVPWTMVTTGAVIEIVITADQNAINGIGPQTMTLTVEGTYSATDRVTSQTQYSLQDLTFYP